MPKAYFKINVRIYYLCGLLSHIYFRECHSTYPFFNNEEQLLSVPKENKPEFIQYFQHVISIRPDAV